MPSATTADSNDSIAPSISIAKAGPISSMTFAPPLYLPRHTALIAGSSDRGQQSIDVPRQEDGSAIGLMAHACG